jgi:proteasome lid subunit RPN8/RPN11
MTDKITVPAQIWKEMLAHLRSVYPEEGCGMLGGKDGRVIKHYPTTNVEPENKQIRYLIDPHQQLAAEEDMDEQGLEVLAIYHSHPKTQARPSPTDVRTAYYPDAFYLLVSFADFENPDFRAYKILKPDPWGDTGEIVEKDLEISE